MSIFKDSPLSCDRYMDQQITHTMTLYINTVCVCRHMYTYIDTDIHIMPALSLYHKTADIQRHKRKFRKVLQITVGAVDWKLPARTG